MTKFISIQDAIDKKKGKVAIRGWAYRERGSSKFKFVVLRDSTNIIQCVIKKEKVGEKKFKIADKLQVEASIELQGTIKEDKRAPTGYEVIVDDFTVVGESHEYPIAKDQSTEFLAENRHLWLRSRKMTAIMKIRHTILQAFREHYLKKGYFEFSPPIFQPTQCEGGATLFSVKYFDAEVYLSQSAQLYSEAMIFALEKIFLISPTFRAEKSKTSRHLTEFWMAEMEAMWIDLDGLADDIEELLTFIVKKVLKDNKEELKILERDIKPLQQIKPPFPRITYDDALKLLKEKCKMKVTWGKDLRTIEEDKLSELFDKPIIITRYPKDIMAFYKPRDPKNPKVALCLDVIAPEKYGEIVGGSQRDLDTEEMKKELKKMGENPKNYEWYLDSRKFGNAMHSGHGMGVERVVSWICGLENIKDSIPFPRTMLRWKP